MLLTSQFQVLSLRLYDDITQYITENITVNATYPCPKAPAGNDKVFSIKTNGTLF